MKQLIMRVKLPSGKICHISNTNSDFVVAWDDTGIGIGIREFDIYTDTKKQLGNTHPFSLKQLECCLEAEINKNPDSSDSTGFGQMLTAIREIIAEHE